MRSDGTLDDVGAVRGWLQEQRERARDVAIVIGGAFGLGPPSAARFDGAHRAGAVDAAARARAPRPRRTTVSRRHDLSAASRITSEREAVLRDDGARRSHRIARRFAALTGGARGTLAGVVSVRAAVRDQWKAHADRVIAAVGGRWYRRSRAGIQCRRRGVRTARSAAPAGRELSSPRGNNPVYSAGR